MRSSSGRAQRLPSFECVTRMCAHVNETVITSAAGPCFCYSFWPGRHHLGVVLVCGAFAPLRKASLAYKDQLYEGGVANTGGCAYWQSDACTALTLVHRVPPITHRSLCSDQ